MEILKINKKFKITLLLLCITALILTIASIYISFIDRGYSEVIFVDVGQGDCCLVRTRDGNAILIDGGDEGSGKYTLIPFLRKKFQTSLDAVFISHLHDDHVSGIYELLDEGFSVKKIYVSSVAEQSEDYSELLSRAKLRDVEIAVLNENELVALDEFTFKVIYAGDISSRDDNDTSMVMRMDCGENSFLFTGDATSRTEKQIIENPDIDTDFIKVAHHGSASSTGKEFIRRVSPVMSIISVGENNRYEHPSESVLNNFAEFNTPVLRTDIDGTITFVIAENNILDIKTSLKRKGA